MAPVSFPGIASGIDYNSIIQKYTEHHARAGDAASDEGHVAQRAAGRAAEDPGSDREVPGHVPGRQRSRELHRDEPHVVERVGDQPRRRRPTTVATPGTYVINSATLATATQFTNDSAANGAFSQTTALANAGASISPNNGPPGTTTQGQITINGAVLHYDVNSTTLQSFVNNAQNVAALSAVGVTMSYDAVTQKVSLSSTQPLTLGQRERSGKPAPGAQARHRADRASQAGPIPPRARRRSAASTSAPRSTRATTPASRRPSPRASSRSTASRSRSIRPRTTSTTCSSRSTRRRPASTRRTTRATTACCSPRRRAGRRGSRWAPPRDTSNFLQAVGFLSNATQPNQLSAGAAVAVGKAAHVQYVDNAGTAHDVYSNSNDSPTWSRAWTSSCSRPSTAPSSRR